jgi:CheY-like chemotaxis protein
MIEKVLFVDDEPNVVEGYRRSLRSDFQIEIATSGAQGLELIKSNGPYAVIVSDMRMPEMDGVQFLTGASELAPDTVRIMLTGNADQQTAMEAVNQGHIFRFLTKPCPPETLKLSLTAALKQYRLVHAEKELLEKTLIGSLQVLTDVLSMVNPTAFGRASRVRRLVRQLSAAMKVEHAWQIEIAAMLSQIGCITVPEEILTKVYEGKQLTPDEAEMIRNYPRVGHDLIARIPRLDAVAEIIAHQEGLATDSQDGQANVSPGARILNLALDFDKLIEAGLSSSEAFTKIRRRGDRYDQSSVTALQDIVAHSETMYDLKEMRISELTEHLVLADDVIATNGTLLVAKGHEINASLQLRLENFLARGNVEDSVKVFVARETPAYRKESVDLPIAAAI